LHDTYHSQQTIPLIPDKNSREQKHLKNTPIQGWQTRHSMLLILKNVKQIEKIWSEWLILGAVLGIKKVLPKSN